jgi:hypothetical protein
MFACRLPTAVATDQRTTAISVHRRLDGGRLPAGTTRPHFLKPCTYCGHMQGKFAAVFSQMELRNFVNAVWKLRA